MERLELLQFARALQTIELRWNCSGFRHRIGAKCAGASERRGPIGKIRIIDIDIGELAVALVPPFCALVGERIR